MIRLAECTHPEAARLGRHRRAVVLLPVGAIEQHGPHLPLLVDWLGAEELARRIAPHLARAGWRPVLAPSLPYGASPLAEDWPGTVSLSPATLRRLIVEIVSGLARTGFRRFVLTNYQADPGQLRALASAVRALTARKFQVLTAGFSLDPRERTVMLDPRVTRLLKSRRPSLEWHSGELETAMVLSTRPALVRRAIARRLPPVWRDFRAALRAGRTFREMAPGRPGYFGSPAVARAATGHAAMALRGRLIAETLLRALSAGRRASDPRRPAPAASRSSGRRAGR
ncbi:MAG: creatininase family protein [Candidatus Rokubacteria bacterium]|nr:creatininase family protein [Candidatus Rokubacteria bacterium]